MAKKQQYERQRTIDRAEKRRAAKGQVPKPRKPKQLDLALAPRTHGGKRAGSGRKRGRRPATLHRRRPKHDPRRPVHVVCRVRVGLMLTLRNPMILKLVKEVLRDQRRSPRPYRKSFRAVEFSVQRGHIHLIVEAWNEPGVVKENGQPYTADDALSGGVRGFEIAFAMRLNRLFGRREKANGKVWFGRYYRVDISSPTQMKRVLRYIFRNGTKHGETQGIIRGLDVYSSGIRFPFFEDQPVMPPDPLDSTEPWPAREIRTWLLREGWRRGEDGPLYSSLAAQERALGIAPASH